MGLLLFLLNKFICGIVRALHSLQYFHQVLVSSSVPLCCLLLCLSALPVENCFEQKSAPHLFSVDSHWHCGHDTTISGSIFPHVLTARQRSLCASCAAPSQQICAGVSR